MPDSYVKRRGLKRSDATRTINKAITELPTSTHDQKLAIMARLEVLRNDLRDLDARILDKLMADPNSTEQEQDDEYSKGVEYEESILDAVFTLKSATTPARRVDPPRAPSQDDARVATVNKISIPQLPLPTYKHREGEDIIKFFAEFESIVSKFSLTQYEQYVYLKSQLSNEPAILLESLDTTNQTYGDAKTLLMEAFASTVVRKFRAIESLTKLRLNVGDDPYRFISNMKQIVQSFETLNLNTDDVLQFFIWSSMNEIMQNQLIAITNKNKPALCHILTKIFEATERYQSVLGKGINSKAACDVNVNVKTCATAVAVKDFQKTKTRAKFCSLCSSKEESCNSHNTNECEKYKTPNEKLERLKQIGGCVKCGHINHMIKNCRFRFDRKCRFCSRFHFSYLCPGAEKINTATGNHGSIFVGRTSLEQYGEDSIIPSFSVTVQKLKLRVMRDSGCQPNFISTEAANKLNLKVLDDDFPITINGINSTKSVKTKVVEIKLLKEHPPVTAICLPEIRIKLKLPRFGEVIKEFCDKGYKLADDFLLDADDSIDDFDFILGNNDAQILPQKEIVFGNKPCSMYADTPIGIVLYGGIKRMISNIGHLPNNNHIKPPKLSKRSNPKQPKLSVGTASTSKVAKDFNELFAFKVSLDASNKISDSILDEAVDDVFNNQIPNMIYDSNNYPVNNIENDRLCDYVLKETSRDKDGRLIAPLLWNDKVAHNLGENYELSKAVLHSNLKRLKDKKEQLKMYDNAIKDHLKAGVVEEIPDLPQYIKEHPAVSFIPHMPVFRMDKQSTKCRVVLLSNLVQNNNGKAISHNQAMVSGANLNSKISCAITKLRFDSHLLIFDIVKAFLNVGLRDIDQDKLIILWYHAMCDKQYKLVAYKYKRLPFGLRCSPNLLMVCLYKMLIGDASDDELKEIKKLIFDLSYMDNCAITSNDPEKLKYYYGKLKDIFDPYQFKLQQFTSNCKEIDDIVSDTKDQCITKLLGMNYNKVTDQLSTDPIVLDSNASTKRQILSSIAKNYDILQINGPLINRARLFMHELQCQKDLKWDENVSKTQKKQWENICNQCNKSPSLTIDRCFGTRDANYHMIAFTDASKVMLGTVLYLQNIETKQVLFHSARNVIVSKQLDIKTIPELELHGISHGVNHMMETYNDLCGERTVVPLNIVQMSLYSDSMVALAWINRTVKLDKMQKVSPFVANRIKKISRLCEKFPVTFNFIAGGDNPADMITRPISYKLLSRSTYLTGPSFLSHESIVDNNYTFVIPSPLSEVVDEDLNIEMHSSTISKNTQHLIPMDKYSTFSKYLRIHRLVNMFIDKLKHGVKLRKNIAHIKTNASFVAFTNIIKTEQYLHFSDVIEFFANNPKTNISRPVITNKLNLFIDTEGIIRVRSKFNKWKMNDSGTFPILLPQNSTLTQLIIRDLHVRFSHGGTYCVMAELRRDYFVPKIYSTVSRVLKDCLICRRVNERTIKNNQSFYKEFRETPCEIPFRFCYIDHFGPYFVEIDGKKKKVWVLLLTCLWSRSINLKMAYDMSVAEFIRSLQLHIFEFGLPERIFSDLGSQLVAGANVVTNLLKDSSCAEYLEMHNMKPTNFTQYYKGKHELGSLVESCVKICKRLINGAIRNNVLKLKDFEFMICQTVSLANKRPVAFQEHLRNTSGADDLPLPITPEILLRGYESPSVNIVPEVEIDEDFKEWNDRENNLKSIKFCSTKLQKVRTNLKRIYHDEFLSNLLSQAVSRNDTFKPVKHKLIKKGDIVLLKEEYMKAGKYPMGRILETTVNDLSEVTGAVIKKGNGEVVKRSVNSLIPYMTFNSNSNDDDSFVEEKIPVIEEIVPKRNRRKKAIESNNANKNLFKLGLA